MANNLWRICVLSSIVALVMSEDIISNETNATNDAIIDPRIQLMPEGKDGDSEDKVCPIEDVSVYMTGCWIDSFNVWQLNVSDISPKGVVRAFCQSSPECGLKFCCAAYQAMRCFSTIGRHFCAADFSRMSVTLGHILNRVCNSVFEDKCRSIVSISESKLKGVTFESTTDTNTSSVLFGGGNEPIVQVMKEPELQKITIQLRFNGCVGAVASLVTVSALLLVGALFV